MKSFFVLVMLALSLCAIGQVESSTSFTGDFRNETLNKVIDELQESTGIQINWSDSLLYEISYTGSFSNESVQSVLRTVLKGTGLGFVDYQSQLFVIKTSQISDDMARGIGINQTLQEFEENRRLEQDFKSISRFSVRGQVIDANDLSPLIGTNVSADQGEVAAVTDINGEYELEMPIGRHTIEYSQVGYEKSVINLFLDKDSTINIQMFDQSLSLDEVVVTGNTLAESVQQTQSSVEILTIESIKSLPTFLGEVDVIKSITSLPGVTTVGEGASGFNVRGGNVDENLILMDGMPIFNSSHLFGFFSVFNSDIVDNFSLYKGGIPATYGGRISSILDVKTAEGSMTNHQLDASAGLVSSKLRVSGPIIKNKTTYSIGSRVAYPTYILNYFPDRQVSESQASFYDINTKFAHSFSSRSKLTVSSYYSNDEFRFGQDTTYKWDNFGTSVQWQRSLSREKTISFLASYSRYNNNIVGDSEGEEFLFGSGINHAGLKGQLINAFSEDGLLEIGFQTEYYDLNTGEIEPTTDLSNINPQTSEKDAGIESALFVSLEKSLTNRLSVKAGLRLSHYNNLGPNTVFTYTDEDDPTLSTIADTLLFGGGLYNGVTGLEPRLNVNYSLSPNSSLKLGYNRTRQNIHVISITSAIAPGDYWKMTDPNIPTTVADQVNVGYYTVFGRVGLSTEAFYKRIDNLLDYRDGAQVFLNPQIETAILRADGRAYGLELKLEKKGRLSGWLSYTFSRSERNNIEDGVETWFPTNYDRPHNLNITSKYDINRRISLSTNFVYSSGRAITIPESGYYFANNLFVNYSERNGGRIPNYHRMDLSLVIDGNLKKKGFKSRWAFSVYNVYSRRNPFSVYFDTIANNSIPQGYRLSILGQAFPSISYSIQIL